MKEHTIDDDLRARIVTAAQKLKLNPKQRLVPSFQAPRPIRHGAITAGLLSQRLGDLFTKSCSNSARTSRIPEF